MSYMCLQLSSDWQYDFDNIVARKFATQSQKEFDSLWTSKKPTEGCTKCNSLLFSSHNVNFSELLDAAEKDCQVCGLICRVANLSSIDGRNDQVVRNGSALTLQPSGHRIIRLCINLGSVEGSDEQTQIGFPVLPEAGHPLRFALIREWLQLCDESHNCNNRKLAKSSKNSAKKPARFLYVGDLEDRDYNPEFLKLVPAEEIGNQKYIALSHCWGEVWKGLIEEERDQWSTTPKGLQRKMEGFLVKELPQTFRDAIEVVRGLNLKYLWIDSLCIIQGDGGDWVEESQKMEDVYASAYCTIAATAADDSDAGFLIPRHIGDYVYIQDAFGRQVYVGNDIADFDNEVEKAELNTRAWVMQERFLSRRTIHFGKKQMYWECGEGVYCEDLTQLKKVPGSLKDFKLDPRFPSLLSKSGFKPTLSFLEDLLKDYSKRALSNPTDRAIALSGLAARIAKALLCEEKYGIFNYYLARNLLWQRHNLQSTMQRIEYKSRDVPSWSWMAYNGGINFMNLDFGKLECSSDVRFDEEHENGKQTLITKVWKFKNCHLKEMEEAESVAADYEIFNSRDAKRGWIVYDVKREADFLSECGVVVGRTRSKRVSQYYMLVVRQRDGKEGEYERVGIGTIQESYLVQQPADIRVF